MSNRMTTVPQVNDLGREALGWRESVDRWVYGDTFQKFIGVAIVLNAIVLGLETAPSIVAQSGWVLTTLDRYFVALFAVEVALKIGTRRTRFFRDAWNLFDLAVVAVALAPAAGPLSVLRVLRILRTLRLFSVVPQMRVVVESLIRAIPGLGSIAALLTIIFYVSAVLATALFGERFDEFFGTLGRSAYTLFQIMTLESWSMGVVRPVMQVYPHAWAFFVPFILLTTFTVLNLFIGVIVEAMQSQQKELVGEAVADARALTHAESAEVMRRIDELHDELGALRRVLRRGSSPH